PGRADHRSRGAPRPGADKRRADPRRAYFRWARRWARRRHERVRPGQAHRAHRPNLPAPAGALVVDGGRRVLMPGLIDNHWHTMLARISPTDLLEGDIGYANLLAGAEAEATL